jgi:tetratricopeptide (TPR) repeat protein
MHVLRKWRVQVCKKLKNYRSIYLTGKAIANNDGKAWYDKTIEMDHKSTDPWNGKGVALDNLGKHNQAIESYDRAIKILTMHAKETKLPISIFHIDVRNGKFSDKYLVGKRHRMRVNQYLFQFI